MIALGDSHTRAYGRNPHFTLIFLGPGKVNNFVDWANVDSMLDKCHRIEAALSPKEVIFCLGEPDTRYALGLRWNPWSSDRLPDESNHIFLDKCAECYLDFYKELVAAFAVDDLCPERGSHSKPVSVSLYRILQPDSCQSTWRAIH